MPHDKGIGTKKTGYADGTNAPFQCKSCEHFAIPDGCFFPKVIGDKKIKTEVLETPEGLVRIIDPRGCCNYFYPQA